MQVSFPRSLHYIDEQSEVDVIQARLRIPVPHGSIKHHRLAGLSGFETPPCYS